MKLNNKTRGCIDRSILCWLATVNDQNVPNVTPKQIFTHHNDTIIVAHIASPNTVRNIEHSADVCLSMVEVFPQAGFKFVGTALFYAPDSSEFAELAPKLEAIAGPKYPILGVIQVHITKIEPIMAPSYRLVPNRSLDERIALTMDSYGVQPKKL